MTYQDALAYFASLEPRGWRLGLDRMAAFCAAAGLNDSIGLTETGPKYVHVAGTNGKGTTTAYLQSLFVEAGFRTGAFFSPYVVDPRERWQFGRELIAPEELADLTERLIPIADSFSETEYSGITEFEFKTAIDFAYAKEKACEWVALEVGLGGRFDATNVIRSRAGAIVSIGMDHVSILGDTLAAIAGEKAGIIKPGVPIVVGEMPGEASDVILAVARESNSEAILWERDFVWEETGHGRGTVVTPRGRYIDITPGIPGAMQGHNFAVAVAAAEAAGIIVDADTLRRAAARAIAPGRFQTIRALGAEIVLDGAHNTEAGHVLARSLGAAFPNREPVLVTNMVRGHEPEAFYRELAGTVRVAHVVPIDFHRAYPVAEACESIERAGIRAVPHDDLMAGLLDAAKDADPGVPVIVAGSFYLVGEAMRLLAGASLRSSVRGVDGTIHPSATETPDGAIRA